MNHTEHTPTPWETKLEEVDKPYIRIRGKRLGSRYKIANVLTPIYEGVTEREAQETRANADFIVRACNAHDDLVGALSDIVDDIQKGRTEWETNGTLVHALSALAKVKAVQ